MKTSLQLSTQTPPPATASDSDPATSIRICPRCRRIVLAETLRQFSRPSGSSPISESIDSCWAERKIPQMDVEREAYQKAGPTQREETMLGQEKEAVTMAVITVAWR